MHKVIASLLIGSLLLGGVALAGDGDRATHTVFVENASSTT